MSLVFLTLRIPRIGIQKRKIQNLGHCAYCFTGRDSGAAESYEGANWGT